MTASQVAALDNGRAVESIDGEEDAEAAAAPNDEAGLANA
jgi:hypothetical protein